MEESEDGSGHFDKVVFAALSYTGTGSSVGDL